MQVLFCKGKAWYTEGGKSKFVEEYEWNGLKPLNKCFAIPSPRVDFCLIVVIGKDRYKILLQKCYFSMNFSTLLLTVLKLCAITKACSGERGMREPQGSREDSAPDARS